MTFRRRTAFRSLSAAVLALSQAAAAPGPAPRVSDLFETTTTEVVLIEFWARDSRGAVTDLTADDIELHVDTHRRPFTSLEPALSPAAARPSGPGTPEPPSLDPEAAPARRFMLFFNDALSKAQGMTLARQAAIRFVENSAVPGDQFALASSEEHRRLRLSQGFTDERWLMVDALNRSLSDPARVSSLLLELERPPSNEAQAHAIGPAPPPSAMAATPAAAGQVRSSGRTMIRGLQALIEMMAPYRGPKAIVYFGDGLFGASRLEIEEVTRMAAAAQVTIHTGNTAGLVAGSADIEVAAASRAASSLATFADETGGVRVLSNEPAKLFQAIAADAAGAYVLSYAPEGPPDGRAHTVRLVCARKDVTLRYRRTFLRETPSEARARRLESAFIAPALHAAFGLDAMAPVRQTGRDLLLYVPGGRLLFLPSGSSATAEIEVGAVALDEQGRELARLSRRMQIRAADSGRLAPLNLLVRGAVPAGSQSVTAIVSDLRSGALGASRLEPGEESHAEGLKGLAVGDPDERSLWVEVVAASPPGAGSTAERPSLRPARRVGFRASERPICEVRLAALPPEGARALRLLLLEGRQTVLIQPLDSAETEADPGRGVVLRVPLALRDLPQGDYILKLEETRPDGPFELGRTPLRIAAAAPDAAASR